MNRAGASCRNGWWGDGGSGVWYTKVDFLTGFTVIRMGTNEKVVAGKNDRKSIVAGGENSVGFASVACSKIVVCNPSNVVEWLCILENCKIKMELVIR